MRSFLLSCLLIFSTVGVIAAEIAVSPAMNAELDAIEGYIQESKSNYKIDEVFPTAKLVLLKDWPVRAQRSIYTKLWQKAQAPLIIDPRDLGGFERTIDIEYSLSGSIIRSVEIDIGAEKTYLAIYNVWGGEWNRPVHFLEYYFLDSNGDLLKAGVSRD